jgi:hypothetical protein
MKHLFTLLGVLFTLLTAVAQSINYRGNLDMTPRTAADAVGSLAYTAGSNNFAIVDVSNPASPFLRGQVTPNVSSITGLEVWGNYAYCAGQSNGLVVINVTNPNSPSWVTNLGLAAAARDVAVYDTLVGVATATNVTLVGVSNPATPHILTTYPRSSSWIEFEGPTHRLHVGSTTGAFALQITINGGNASLSLYDQFDTQSLTPVAYAAPYVNAVSGASVRVIDATSYSLAGQYTSTGNIRAITSGYLFSFIGLQTGTVQYLDQRSATPVFLDGASVPGPSPVAALALAQAGNQPLVVVGHGTGLAVFDYDALTSAPDEPPSIPRDLSLSAYPNPFNGLVTVTLTVPQGGSYQFSVFDNLGRVVWNRALFLSGTANQKLDFSSYAAGQYIARLSGTSGATSLRLIYLP